MIENRNIEAIYPLSPLQRGILFHSLYDPHSGVYFEQASFTLLGKLDVPAFERAWQQATDRHSALRSLFVWEGQDKPLQVVVERVDLPWQKHDWRGLSASEQQEKFEAFLKADRGIGFDLAQALLMRFALMRTGEDSHRVVWSFHHLLLDGWSLALVLEEVFAYYEALRSGRALPLEPARQYRDYIAWLQQQDLFAAEQYWREFLKGFKTPTPLRVNRVATLDDGGGHKELEINLSQSSTAALNSLARQRKLTLNTLVQGAWALLLSRYSGERDIVYGHVVSGRPPTLPGVESIVGLFINTLPMRARIPADDSILSWLQRLQDQQAEMIQYEHSPLVEIQGWSAIARGTPLFESLFVFESYPAHALMEGQGDGLLLQDFRSVETTNYPLTLVVGPGPELLLRATYDPGRFDKATINRMLGHLRTLLEGLTANIDGRISELPLLTEQERAQLLVEWNDTAIEAREERRVHELFETQAAQTPDAVAVFSAGERLTYGELNQRANQLAHHLRSLGVGPESLVGLLLERSCDLIIAILGVLKAGGAYVPLDTEYPRERLAYVVEDAGIGVLIVQERFAATVPEGGPQRVRIDADWKEIAVCEGGGLDAGVTSENAAYVIYTSGSTGRPKGVVVTHRGLVNYLLNWCERAYPLKEGRGSIVHSSMAFDLTVTGLFAPLLVGRGVWLISESGGAEGLGEALSVEGNFSLIKITPAHLELIGRQLAPHQAAGRTRAFVIGGEALTYERLAYWRKFAPDTLLFNEYGPTETVVGCCVYQIPAGSTESGPVPIGRPISNTQLYILDSEHRPVPIGVTGELHIGGDGLARGYLKRPAMTAEKFIPHPFGASPGARLYKTGDLARYLPDGTIEYLGRIDRQVKIRGHRIEPGEIEAALESHPSVLEASVIARGEGMEPLRLVAYVVPDPAAQPPTVDELRELLKASLPGYMLPSAFMMLARLPLTFNGKLDRQSLPAPDQVRPELKKRYVAPVSAAETQLARIWAGVFGIDRVGIHDNFFELGGHSLMVMQVASRVYEEFKVEMPLRRFFEAPTITEQIVAIALEQASQSDGDEVARLLAELE